MKMRVWVLFGSVLLLAGWNACGTSPDTGAEPISASIPTPSIPDEPAQEVGGPDEPAQEVGGPDAPVEGTGPGAQVACKSVPPDLPLGERCAAAGAVVHTFPNTCVGSCKAAEEMMMCGQAFTQGCRCMDGHCIDDETGCCREIRK